VEAAEIVFPAGEGILVVVENFRMNPLGGIDGWRNEVSPAEVSGITERAEDDPSHLLRTARSPNIMEADVGHIAEKAGGRTTVHVEDYEAAPDIPGIPGQGAGPFFLTMLAAKILPRK
jgi:hypothetical protein